MMDDLGPLDGPRWRGWRLLALVSLAVWLAVLAAVGLGGL